MLPFDRIRLVIALKRNCHPCAIQTDASLCPTHFRWSWDRGVLERLQVARERFGVAGQRPT